MDDQEAASRSSLEPPEPEHVEEQIETGNEAQKEEDQSPMTQSPVRTQSRWVLLFKRLWWVLASVLLVIAALVVYLVYENHRTAVYNSYLQGASDAMNNNDYELAITDYTKALSFKSVPSVQSELENAKALQSEHKAYEAGMTDLNAGKYASAITSFNKVTSQDKVDYADAQKKIAKANADITAQKDQMIATTMYSDAQSLLNDISSLETDTNTIANTEDGITNDTVNSAAFNTDMGTLQGALSSLGTDLSTLESDGGQFNTDSQGLNNAKINTIATKIVASVNQLENDYSDMDSIANNNVNSLQNQETSNTGYAFYPYLNSNNTVQWNSDITDSDNQSNVLTNLVSQLKAYSSTTSSSASNNNA